MVRVSPPALMTRRCRYGMLVTALSPSPMAVIAMLCTQWRGRLMARTLRRALMIPLCRCGMLMMALSPSPIAAIAMVCGQWFGRLMAAASPQALEIRLCKCGRPYRRGVVEEEQRRADSRVSALIGIDV